MGVYTSFLDLTLGVSTPVLGLLATHAGVGNVFAVCAALIALSAAVSLALMARSQVEAPAA